MKFFFILALVPLVILLLTYSGYAAEFAYTSLTYPASLYTYANGISGSNIVGYYFDSMYHGFLFDGTKWSSLDYPGASYTFAFGIDGNNIVGSYAGFHGFLFDGTKWSPLDYPGSFNTEAYGISGNNIVGYYQDATGYHGFLFDGTKWSSLNYPGAILTIANGISGSNVVGYYQDATGYHGFLFDGTKWSSLNYPGAFYAIPLGISGSNIVGYYANVLHGFLATPATPIVINYLVNFVPIISTYSTTNDTSGCPAGFVGTFSFDAWLKNTSAISLSDLEVKVTTLTGRNLLKNADRGAGGARALLTVPLLGTYADNLLRPNESVNVHFALCLKTMKSFQFFVDVLGIHVP